MAVQSNESISVPGLSPLSANRIYQESKPVSGRQIKETFGTADLSYKGDSHLLTIAPTGSGKGRSVIIPNLLHYSGPVIVIDPKGENYAVTAHYREKKMGQKVIVLDPFNKMVAESHGFNPLDIFGLEGSDLESDAEMIADMLSNNPFSRDPFWDISAKGLISGLLAYIANEKDSVYVSRTIASLTELMMGNLTTKLTDLIADDYWELPNLSSREFSSFLAMPETGTAPSVLATANSFLKCLIGKKVEKCLEKSSFDLKDVVDGKPLSIYIIIPPDKLSSHRSLLRLWIGALMKAISGRSRSPERSTLFMLDEAGQLGSFSYLETAITLLRGYGLQTWSFWQDLNQMKSLYPDTWPTMVNNCAVVQIFGLKNYRVAREFADVTGVDVNELDKIKKGEQLLMIDGHELYRTKLFDYLKDPKFKRKFKENPLYIGRPK